MGYICNIDFGGLSFIQVTTMQIYQSYQGNFINTTENATNLLILGWLDPNYNGANKSIQNGMSANAGCGSDSMLIKSVSILI